MFEREEHEGSSSPVVRTPTVKGKYTSPKLVEYGSVAKLTQGQTGTTGDGASGMFMTCL